MKLISTIVFFVVCINSRCQTIQTARLADSLLKSGTFKVSIVKYEFSDEVKALQSKSLKNLLANPKWADKYIVIQIENGSPGISFMEDYGLSKEEYNVMYEGFKNRKNAILQDTFTLRIVKRKGLITFKSNKKLTPFNYLSIDVKKSTIIYDNYLINREVKLEGKHYAPILYGYESFGFDSPAIKGKKKMSSIGVSGFSIGHNLNDNRITMALLIQTSFTTTNNIVITLLK